MSLFDINVMLGPTATDSEPSLPTVDDLLREMDRQGIAEALVYSSHAQHGHPREGNRELLHQIEGHRDRLHPCWMALPPTPGERPTPEDLVPQMRDNGVLAARILPGKHNFPLSRRILGPLLEALEAKAIPLIIDLERPHWSTISPWDDIFSVCEAFPRLPIILLREGGVTGRLLYDLWKSLPNLYLETSYLQTARCLEEICQRFGSGRLLFGSGVPRYDAGGAIATLHGSALTDEQRSDIAGNNARGLLRLRVSQPLVSRVWPVDSGGLRVWDIHGHLGPWYKLHYPVHDAPATVKRMDEVGIERLNISDIKAIGNDPDAGNARMLRACAEFPGRIYGYAGYAPSKYANNVAAFEKLLGEPGVVGIKLHCALHETPPDSPKYRPAYELANEAELPVLCHGKLAPEDLRSLLTELPKMSFIAAHMAGSAPESIGPYIELARECPNFYMDATLSTLLRGAFARLVAQVPAEQILIGSDFPIMDFPYQLGRVLYADISDELKRKVLWENPSRLFRV